MSRLAISAMRFSMDHDLVLEHVPLGQGLLIFGVLGQVALGGRAGDLLGDIHQEGLLEVLEFRSPAWRARAWAYRSHGSGRAPGGLVPERGFRPELAGPPGLCVPAGRQVAWPGGRDCSGLGHIKRMRPGGEARTSSYQIPRKRGKPPGQGCRQDGWRSSGPWAKMPTCSQSCR